MLSDNEVDALILVAVADIPQWRSVNGFEGDRAIFRAGAAWAFAEAARVADEANAGPGGNTPFAAGAAIRKAGATP